jgi:hypothetical protein
MFLSATYRKARRQEQSLIMDNLNIIAIGSGGEAGFVAGHGFFQLFARLGVALLGWFESGAPHPLIEGPRPSP